jgi:hypothetical protein
MSIGLTYWRLVGDMRMTCPFKGRVLGLRVAYQNIVSGNKKSVCDFPLRRKALADAGSSQDKTVGVFKLLSVSLVFSLMLCRSF